MPTRELPVPTSPECPSGFPDPVFSTVGSPLPSPDRAPCSTRVSMAVRPASSQAGRSCVPEGHTLHRIALEHRRLLAGQAIRASSPQGRFAAGAALLDGRVLTGVDAYGKHLDRKST